MADLKSTGECPCTQIVDGVSVFDPEDELLVVDVPTDVVHRCRLCGRKVTLQHVPGDYVVGDDRRPVSVGVRAKPILAN